MRALRKVRCDLRCVDFPVGLRVTDCLSSWRRRAVSSLCSRSVPAWLPVSQTGVNGQTILLGESVLTGNPSAKLGQDFAPGSLAYIDWINFQGGLLVCWLARLLSSYSTVNAIGS